MSVRRRRAVGAKDTASKMADAVSYLCRVAAEAGFVSIVIKLSDVREKLEALAAEPDEPKVPS